MPGALIPVRAFAVAATVPPKTLSTIFPPDKERVRTTKSMVVVRYGDASWAISHDFGAVVFVGVEPAECDRVMKALVAEVGDEPRAPLEDSFAVEVAPGEPAQVRFDRAVVSELDGRTAAIVGLVLAQSVAMEYYEADLDALVAALEKNSDRLATVGKLRGREKEMLQFIGRGMTMRSRVIHTLSLLDSPAVTWEVERLDRLYRDLRVMFEIEERYRALDHEIRIVQDNLALLVDLVRQRRSNFLEWTVAVFVVVETLLFLGQLLLGK